jgi:hypothetical protein
MSGRERGGLSRRALQEERGDDRRAVSDAPGKALPLTIEGAPFLLSERPAPAP